MKKEEFLNKLREKISILKKEEQDDIINEYSEHIEEKLKKKEKEENYGWKSLKTDENIWIILS